MEITTVCGAKQPPEGNFVSTLYKGRRIYFCEPECLEKFRPAPDHFLATHGPVPFVIEDEEMSGNRFD